MTRVTGVLLAAGAGTRMGRPKALMSDEHGSWLARACAALADGGCDNGIVVLGASADEARGLLDGVDADIVEATDWPEGMGASLRAGLTRAGTTDAGAALVHLVDLPDVGADVVARVLALTAPDALVRATYRGRPGHPVLIGRDHWSGVIHDAKGDRGARNYLDSHDAVDVDCSDLASGRDVDEPGPMLGR